jgi:peptidoglycan/LPS O-acetylase OafA/YrhL
VAVKSFFVISGLLIWISAFNTNTWKAYLIKRAFRIYPALIFILLISSLIFLIYYKLSVFDIIRHFSWNSIFLSFMGKSVGDVFETNVLCAVDGSLSTLKLEVSYCVFVGVVLYCFDKRAYSLIVGFTVLSYLLESGFLLMPNSYSSYVKLVDNQIPFKFYYFGFGVVFL